MLKIGIPLSLVLFTAAAAEESVLTEGDRQALLERLEVVQEAGGKRAEAKQEDAYTVFKAAAQSDKASEELWLQCAEKVAFTDEKRASQSFREWRRGNDGLLDSDAFHRALRHQLAWIVLGIDAERGGSSEAMAISARAVKAIDTILEDGDILEEAIPWENGRPPAFQVLRESAFESNFVKAYDVSAPSDWPGAPLEIEDVYRQVVLPPYEKAKNFANYRNAWQKMTVQLATLAEATGREAETGGKSPAFERFVSERRPELQWELERNIFELGDERAAAKNMLAHLEENEGHEKELAWAEEFKNLLERSGASE